MRRRRPRAVQPYTAIVVLGYHEFDAAGRHGISEICRAGVRRARRLVDEVRPRAVVFTGWSSGAGPAEADQMIALWGGPEDVLVVREPLAIDTAENATRSLALLRRLGGIDRVIVVCSIRHVLRVPFFFRSLYARHGIRTRYSVVWRPWPPARIWMAELAGITRMLGDRRRSRNAFERGEHEPRGDEILPR